MIAEDTCHWLPTWARGRIKQGLAAIRVTVRVTGQLAVEACSSSSHAPDGFTEQRPMKLGWTPKRCQGDGAKATRHGAEPPLDRVGTACSLRSGDRITRRMADSSAPNGGRALGIHCRNPMLVNSEQAGERLGWDGQRLAGMELKPTQRIESPDGEGEFHVSKRWVPPLLPLSNELQHLVLQSEAMGRLDALLGRSAADAADDASAEAPEEPALWLEQPAGTAPAQPLAGHKGADKGADKGASSRRRATERPDLSSDQAENDEFGTAYRIRTGDLRLERAVS